MEVSSQEDSAGEFCCVGSIFSIKLLVFLSKEIKLLLSELGGQCRNILTLAFSALTSLWSVNTEKVAGILSFTNWLPYLYGRIQSPRPDVMPDRMEGITRAAGFGFACIDTQAS